MRPPGYYVERALAYQAAVLAGDLPACRWVQLACERNARDLALAAAGQAPWRFDVEAAERPCRAAEELPHVKGPKAKLLRQVVGGRLAWRWQTLELEPWQCWFVCVLFGWVWTDTGFRRFQRALLMVPRKNAKTTLLAVLCLYMLACDGEVGADVFSAATKAEQARIVFSIAKLMVKRAPEFQAYFGVQPMESKITVEATGSEFAPLSADDKTLDGLNPYFAAVDELHAHRTRGVWDVLVTAQGSRDQPLLLAISTAGFNLGGICHEVLSYGMKVLEQQFEDDQFLCVNYTIDEEDKPHWDTEPVLRKANPNWGVSINPRTLIADAAAARRSPSATNNFLCKHLNVWVRAASPWMPMEAWAACADPSLTLDDFLTAERCVITVDLAEVRDIASVVVAGRFVDGRVKAIAKHFYPEAAIEASPVAQLAGWAAAGALIKTPGEVHDFEALEEEIATVFDQVRAVRVGFDRAMAAYMMQRLQKRLGEEVVTVVTQNVKTFNPAMKDLLGRVQARTFVHTGDPVLTWMVSNVAEKRTHLEESYPVKANGKDSPEKIDGAVALLMAVSELLAGEPDADPDYVPVRTL